MIGWRQVSDVRVAPPNPVYGDNPYTLQPGGCGERGQYIHVTPDYLRFINGTMKQRFGPAGDQKQTLIPLQARAIGIHYTVMHSTSESHNVIDLSIESISKIC